MGFNGQFALHKFHAAHVGLGSRAPEPVAARQLGMSALLRRRPDWCDAAVRRLCQRTNARGDAEDCSATAMGADGCARTESLARIYERPALRKFFAAFAADSKVAWASLAVMAIVVSTSDRLPPPAAASTAEAAAFSSGNSPIASQSVRPKVRYQPMSLPPTLLNSLATASSRFSGFASMRLIASEVNRPREM